jgi:outer membrane lipoprotein SlyB
LKENDAMEKTRSSLHPLLTAAAISVTALSAVGVATLTGLIPSSLGSSKPAAPVVQSTPSIQAVKPAQAATGKPARKPAPRSAPPRAADPQPIQVAQAADVGIVESVKQVESKSDGRSGVGAIGGGIAGAVIGNQFGKGTTRNVLTVLGAAGGALAGKEIEKRVRVEKRWETTVRFGDGSSQTVSSPSQPAWHAGDRVRLYDGGLQRA